MNFLQKQVNKKYGKHGGYFFYRCRACQKLMDKEKIRTGGCCGQFSPAKLTWWEEIKIIMSLLWK